MERDSAVAATGAVAVVLTLSAVMLATLVSPAFEWTGNALSNLGVTSTDAGTGTTVVLFNGGLVLGGILGLVFAWGRWQNAGRRGGRVVAVLLGLTMAAMGAVGVFPQGNPLHFPAALAFYVLITVTIWADSVVTGKTPEGLRGAVTAWLGLVNVLAWAGWVATGPLERPGLAIPEIIGALVLSAWVVSEAIRLSSWDRSTRFSRRTSR